MRGLALFVAVAATLVPWGSVLAEDELRFVTLNYAPFVYGVGKSVAGPAPDLVDAACGLADITCTYRIYPWPRSQALLKSGAADGAVPLGRNPSREAWLRFSPPIFRNEYGFFVPNDNPLRFEDPSQIAGYRVGVLAPSNAVTLLDGIREEMISRRLEPITIESHPSDNAGMRKLAAGRLDAVYSNEERGWEMVREEDLGGRVRYAGEERVAFFYAAIDKSYPKEDVVDRFFGAIRALFADGEAQAIINSYGLEEAVPEETREIGEESIQP